MTPALSLTTVTLGAADPAALARFYRDLLGWPAPHPAGEDETWVALRNPDGGIGLAFQYEPCHVPAVWPGQPGEQQMMAHLEIRVDDLDSGVRRALDCGASLADFQPQQDVRVCFDPAGHPFCLWIET